MAENPLTKLPLVGQLGLSAGLALVIGGAFWYFYWQDAEADETKKRTQLSALKDEIRALEVIKNKQAEFLRELEQRKSKLELLKRILPADKETPELMKKVQYLATQSTLLIRKFNPGATQTKQFETGQPAKPGGPAAAAGKPPKPGAQAAQDSYQEWPITVDVEGTYHNLGLFLDRVSRLSRLVNVGNFKVKSQSAPRPSSTITVSCVATTYVYVEAPPARPAGPAAPRP